MGVSMGRPTNVRMTEAPINFESFCDVTMVGGIATAGWISIFEDRDPRTRARALTR